MKKTNISNVKYFLLLLLLFSNSYAQEFNTIMMNSTFMIIGNKCCGTGFIVTKSLTSDTSKQFFILISAKHVFDDNDGDYVTLNMRKKKENIFQKLPTVIRIRENGKNLYSTFPEEDSIDAAVLTIGIPDSSFVQFISYDFLVDDNYLEAINLHPGDNLFSLGFPHGVPSNDAGFPILRSGNIASYPVFPSSLIKKILYDVEVFPGNSGGPVYLYQENRVIDNTYLDRLYVKLVDLLSVSFEKTLKYDYPNGQEKKEVKLNIAGIVPAHYIIELINSLKEPK